MWSLKAGLARIAGHAPSHFNPTHGIKSLFPAGYAGSLSALQNYVFCMYARVATDYNFGRADSYNGSAANAYVAADGMGRWWFSWQWWPIKLSQSYERQAGFAFRLGASGSVHVFTDSTKPAANTMSCSGGTDPWIANNWPSIFADSAQVTLFDQTTTNLSRVWTSLGFGTADAITLQGGPQTTDGTTTGNAFFPYPCLPNRLYSHLGSALGPVLTMIGQLILNFPKELAGNFTTGDGITFGVSPPPSDNHGTMTLSFNNASGNCTGGITWDAPAGNIRMNGQNTFTVPSGRAFLSYTYKLTNTGGPNPPKGTLDYTVRVVQGNNTWCLVQAEITDGQIISQTVSQTTNGAVTAVALTTGPDGSVSVGGSASPGAVVAAVAAMPVTDLEIYGSGIQPLTAFLAGLTQTGIWPGSTAYGAYGSSADWTATANGYQQSWGAGDTQFGPALYNFSFTQGSDGTPNSYSIVGTLNQAIGVTANGLVSCKVDITTDNAQCFANVQTPVTGGTVGTTTTTEETGGVVTIVSSDSFASNIDGSSYAVTVSSVGGVATSESWSFTDNAGNNATCTLTYNSDGTSTLTIANSDPSGNGTIQTIQINASGSATSDTTVSTGGGGAGNVQAGSSGESSGSDDGGGDDGGDEDEDEDES